MTHSEKLAVVRQKVIEACPDVWPMLSPPHNDRIPRLEHVLRALDKNIGLWQWHPTYKPITVIEALLCDANWKLEKDLSGQPKATIDFLYSVFYGS